MRGLLISVHLDISHSRPARYEVIETGTVLFWTLVTRKGIEKSKFITIKAYDLKEKPPSAAGVAELAKGAGLKILFRRDTRVQIPPPAWVFPLLRSSDSLDSKKKLRFMFLALAAFTNASFTERLRLFFRLLCA